MARYQKTNPRPDTAEKRSLTAEDITFLAALRDRLNTQDTMGQAAPRYWVVAQSEESSSPPDVADTFIVYDGFDRMLSASSEASALEQWIAKMDEAGHVRHHESLGGGVFDVTLHGPEMDAGADVETLAQMERLCRDAGLGQYSAAYARRKQTVVTGPVFLTHAACEEHLKRYSYRYEPDAHAYALTASDCPEIATLLDILASVRWEELPATPEADADNEKEA